MTNDDELEQMCSTTLANDTPLYWVEKIGWGKEKK